MATSDADDRQQWATSVVLSDGESAFLRPMTAADAPALLAFHQRQPRDNQYRRFLSPKPTLNERELEHFTHIDFHDRVALVIEEHGDFIAWASYERWKDRNDAEVAFMVDDRHQGRGIATILLEHLAAIARANGIDRFTAETLSDNRSMLRVFGRAGWPLERHWESGLTELEFPLDDTERFVDSVESREHRGDSRAIARLLLPKSVAVIGASDVPGSVGEDIWRNVTEQFGGAVYAVNPNRERVADTPTFPTVDAIPDDITLAVVVVPADQLALTIQQCIDKRVRGAVVITVTDEAGPDIPSLVAHARRHGLRLIGPASMGVSCPGTPGGLNAAITSGRLLPGNVAMSMQSGSLGGSVVRLAMEMRLGMSWFVSLGDKSDVSGNDLLQFWEDDEATAIIAIYTETFGNPRKFARLARRIGRTKPIVAVRTGTAAIGPGSSALYQQAGLIEVPTVRAMLDVARVMSSMPAPRGPRVALLSNARSPSVLARAALETAGLDVVNPADPLTWRSDADDYRRAICAAMLDDAVDAVMVIHAPPLASSTPPIAEIEAAVDDARRSDAGAATPLVAVMLGATDGPLRPGSRVPAFSFPEPAAAVLGRMWAYGRWRATEADAVAAELDDVDRSAVSNVLNANALRSNALLSLDDTAAVLDAYRVTMPRSRRLDSPTPDELARCADDIGYPVVLKSTHRRVGRSARAGIALDLADEHALHLAAATMRDALGADAGSFVVQEMVAPGVDVRIACTTDPLVGPVLSLDLGSLQRGVEGAGVSRLVPLSQASARALVASSPVATALEAAGLDVEPLIDAVVRIAQLMADHGSLREIVINPAIVSEHACVPTDVRIELDLEPPARHAVRRLV